MERKSWKILSLLTMALILLAGGSLIWASVADSTRVVIRCPAGTHTHTCHLNSGPRLTITTAGSIGAAVGDHFTTSDGREGTQLEVVELQSSGWVEGIGEATFTLDTSRGASSSIVANQADARFPATQTMRFYTKLTLNGQSFDSSDPVEVVNTAVTSFPPPPGTIYVLTHEMKMTSDSGDVLVIDPGKAFTVGQG